MSAPRLPTYLAVLLLSLSRAAFAVDGYTSMEFSLPGNSEQLLVADTDGDGRRELLTVSGNEVRVYFQNGEGFDFASGFQSITLPGTAIGWDLSRGYDPDGNLALVALIDGREVRLWRIRDRRISEPELLLDNLGGFVPRGVHRLHFSRDINGDIRDDLIIPGAGVLNLHISTADAGYEPAISVQTEMQMRTVLSPGRLEREVGQSLTIPLMELRDINADGAPDLVSRTETQLDVFLAQRGAARYFNATPTYSVDIAAIEERLGEFDLDRLDFSNLTGILAITHEELLEDVDGDGIDDLLLREGGKVSLFGGNATGMDLEQPRQVLRSGGNVLSVFLYDEDEDGLKDLWLWRVETISVGDIFLWLALSGDIAVEAFIYPNEGERFARRPTRRITVNLKFPSALRLAGQAMDIARQARETGAEPIPPNVLANLDDDQSRQDLLVLADSRLELFLDVVEPVTRTDPFLDGLGYNRNQDEYEIDIRDVLGNISINGTGELQNVAGRNPDQSLPIDGDISAGDVLVAELNGDDRDDIFVFTRRDNVQINGILLLSIPQ
ncbi:MAG: VCBS repeat-containing protein [Gammaproteobacteria bacterium]